MLLVFVLGCFLTMCVEKSNTLALDDSDQIEDFIPLLFPNMFSFYNRNSSGPKLHLNQEYLNSSNGLLAKNSDGFVKGYSIKIPKRRLLNRGYQKMKEIEKEARTKRGVIQVYNMVSCATGCNPLIYKGYGCFCGFLGSGNPMDGIDSCCQTHDWCYDNANCPMYFIEYFIPYYWKCRENTPICAFDHGIFGGPESCADKLCKCDRALSECLKRYPCPYKRTFCESSSLRLFQNVFMSFT